MENDAIEAEVRELVSKINWQAQREEFTQEIEDIGETLRNDYYIEINDAELFSAISNSNTRDIETLIYDKLRRQADALVRAKATEESLNNNGRVQIVRTAHRGACQYCLSLEFSGDYYEAPYEIYKRHGGCVCDIRYYKDGEEQERVSKSRLSKSQRTKGIIVQKKRKITL